MTTYRIPLLAWQDFDGGYTAAPVEAHLAENQIAAFADTRPDAVHQIQAYLAWHLKTAPWLVPDFFEPRLTSFRVSIRPEYRSQHRVYPCQQEIVLRVPCVLGCQANGLLQCSMPTLRLMFHFHQEKELQRMVAETVRQTLAGRTPQQLSRYLAPASVFLEVASVRVPQPKPKTVVQDSPPTLGQIGQALGQASFRKQFAHAWQRDSEVADLMHRVGQEKTNVVLVGPRGSGKTTVLAAAVRNLERTRLSELRQQAQHVFWQTNAGRLIAGMQYLGQWQERMEQVIEELSSIGGTLCIESLLDLVQQGGSGAGGSLAAFCLPYLREGQLQMVGEATPEEMTACRHLLPGFADVFQVLRLQELDDRQARAALQSAIEARTRQAKIPVEPPLPNLLFRLFRRFLPYRPLPGSAIPFLTRLFDTARQQRVPEIAAARAVEQFIDQTGLPEHLLRDDQPLHVEALERTLGQQVIGQAAACRILAEMIARFKAGLQDPRRPLGALLFCGPTGVGKTQLAKTVAQYLFGHGRETDRLIRLDMSEYSAPFSAPRLITKADGTPSDLIQRVRQQPFVVVLLDEIEKAADSVFDVLLGLLDEGRLTDRWGRTTTFCSAIVIMTSNLGASARSTIGLGAAREERYETEVRSFFRPEFFNRLDGLVTFQPLDWDTCLAITRKELDEIQQRAGIRRSGLKLRFSPELVQHLARDGFDPRFGARPLQRMIEIQVVATLARHLVDRPELRDGTLQIGIDAEGEVQIL
jgi:ATP-dependent Clp protease ATP-binding subunit ClpC